MTFKNKLVLPLFALLFASMLGCAGGRTKESSGEYVDDSVITAKVKTAIFNEPGLKSSEINVETFKGRVQLSGFVANPNDAARATQVAQTVPGVYAVKNDIRMK